MCESRGGHPGLPVPNKPYGFCGHKQNEHLKKKKMNHKNVRHRSEFVLSSSACSCTQCERAIGCVTVEDKRGSSHHYFAASLR